jgi:SET domain-containing protein
MIVMPSETTSHRTIHSPDVTVGDSPGRGRGVFAGRRFAPGETIEVCPVIALSETDARKLDDTKLSEYYFGWGKDGKQAGIVLGYGSIYNHSFAPNAAHYKNTADSTMTVAAVSEIAAGEEILIHYETGKDGQQKAMWFEVR